VNSRLVVPDLQVHCHVANYVFDPIDFSRFTKSQRYPCPFVISTAVGVVRQMEKPPCIESRISQYLEKREVSRPRQNDVYCLSFVWRTSEFFSFVWWFVPRGPTVVGCWHLDDDMSTFAGISLVVRNFCVSRPRRQTHHRGDK